MDVKEARDKLRAVIAEQDAKRGRPLTATEQLANLAAAMARCDQCDNGIEPEWPFCPWCGWQLWEEDTVLA